MHKKSIKSYFVATAVFLPLVLFLSLEAADWPNWRGPNNNGISNETRWNPAGLDNVNIVWRTDVGMGHSSVAVKDNLLYVMGNKKNMAGGENSYFDTVYCFDAVTGKEIWQYSYPCGEIRYPGPRTTPTVDENRLYTLSWEGQLICFDALKGDVIWKKDLVADNLSQRPDWGFSGSPIIEGNILLLTAGRSGVALDKRNGRVIWKSEPTRCNLPSPVIFSYKGNRLAAIASGSEMHIVDIKNGKVQWSFPWGRNMYMDPTILGEKIFMPGFRGCTLAELNGGELKILMQNPRSRLSTWLGYVLLNDHVYGFRETRNNVILVCVDVKNGDIKWEQEMGRYGSLMAADGKLIILNSEGKLFVVDASPQAYKMISCAKVLKMTDNAGLEMPRQCHCWTNPVLANGKIYARNNHGELVCVDMGL